MNKIPSLPFACSIVRGELHTGLIPKFGTGVNLSFLTRLNQVHQNDIPKLLSDRMARKITVFKDIVFKDLLVILFGRSLSTEPHGIICTPVVLNNKERTYLTIAYHFVKQEKLLEVCLSVQTGNGYETIDFPFFAFSVTQDPESLDMNIKISADVMASQLLGDGTDSNDVALQWARFICTYEAIVYSSIHFNSSQYEPMLMKKGEYINPNLVKVDLLSTEEEEDGSL